MKTYTPSRTLLINDFDVVGQNFLLLLIITKIKVPSSEVL